MKKVFIDGSAGTTGLRIHQRLSNRNDLWLITLPEEHRKDPVARKEAINSSDITFLCLPDDAAAEAVSYVENPNTVIIDTSTANRTSPNWTYGFPELVGNDTVAASKRIANPGCHASGFIALIKPLRDAGIIRSDAHLTCYSLTGYSGGGKKMIADYEAKDRPAALSSPRQYALTQQHKHLKEMVHLCALDITPMFCPVVCDFYSGMQVTVPVFAKDIYGTANDIRRIYKQLYKTGLVRYTEKADDGGFIAAGTLSDKDDMLISVYGNEDRILLVASYDNLGKGASGAAIQNMNIVLGQAPDTGLEINGGK